MSSLLRALAASTVLLAAIVLASAAPASAYDTGPHFEVTEDAMRAEGFNSDAVGVTQVNNWFVDFYEQADSNPFSGHGGFLKRLLAGAITTEGWPDDLQDLATKYGCKTFDDDTAGCVEGAAPADRRVKATLSANRLCSSRRRRTTRHSLRT